MSTRTPTNRSFKVEREGQAVAELVNLTALLLPARPEIVAMQGLPAGHAFEIYFRDVVAVQEQDRLVNENDANEHYRIIGVSQFDTPNASHTEVIAEARWGT